MKMWIAYCFNLLRAAFESIWFPIKANFCNNFSQPVKTGFVARQVWSWKVSGKKRNIAFHSTCFAASCETSCIFCYCVVLVSQAKGLANFTINCILYVYIITFKKTFDICDLSHENVAYGLQFSNGYPYVPHSCRESAPTHGNKKYLAHHS